MLYYIYIYIYIGGKLLSEKVGNNVARLAFAEQFQVSLYIRKKASACLLSLLRQDNKIYDHQKWPTYFMFLLQIKDYGVLLAATGLILYAIESIGGEKFLDSGIPQQCVEILVRIGDYSQDYLYYFTPCPWLQIKLLKILQEFPPPGSSDVLSKINGFMEVVLRKTVVTDNPNKNNADHSILFESMNLAIHYGDKASKKLKTDVITILVKYIAVREPNIRYLALETMSKLQGTPVTNYLISQHKDTILISLRDHDISIRRRALELLFAMCSKEVAQIIVEELINYLYEKDYQLKQELVLKIAVLAEKYASKLEWYVDVILKLIEYAGDYVSDDIWFRVAQIVTGFGSAEPNTVLQKYCALKVFQSLNTAHAHPVMIMLGSYILSEYGYLIAPLAGKGMEKQFEVLHRHHQGCTDVGRAQLLTAYSKLLNQCAELEDLIIPIFEFYEDHWNVELQQRACEYLALSKAAKGGNIGMAVLDKMPTFSDSLKNSNVLLRRMYKMKAVKGISKDIAKPEQVKEKDFKTNIASTLKGGKKGAPLPVPSIPSLPQSAPDPAPILPPPKNLLDFDEEEGKGNTETLKRFETMSIEGGAPISHPFFMKYMHKFASKPTVDPKDAPKLNIPTSNQAQWKSLISTQNKEGLIYEDQQIQIGYKSEFFKFVGRIILNVAPKAGKLSKLQGKVSGGEALGIQVSAFRMVEEKGQVMLQMMLQAPLSLPPLFHISYLIDGLQSSATFTLPILLNKFLEVPGSELDLAGFSKFWEQITERGPESFQKLDVILKNPAPPTLSHIDVLQKMAQLLGGNFGLKPIPPTDIKAFTELSVAGQVIFKSYKQTQIPNNPHEMIEPIVVPVLIQIEFYPDISMDEFRFSVRSNDSMPVALSLLSLFKFFANPTS